MDDGGAILLVLSLAAVLGLIPANIAQGKGRSFGAWWVFGFLLFLPALIASLVISDRSELRALKSGQAKKCPYCHSTIARTAQVCRFCSRDLTGEAQAVPTPASPSAAGRRASSTAGFAHGASARSTPSVDLEALERLASLRERGALTEEEFTDQKKRILDGAKPVQAASVQDPAGLDLDWAEELSDVPRDIVLYLAEAGAVEGTDTTVSLDAVVTGLGYDSRLTPRRHLSELERAGRVTETNGQYQLAAS